MTQRAAAPVIVVTGISGSGKSTVADVFRRQGARVLDVDRLAHRLLEPRTPTWLALLKELGVPPTAKNPVAGFSGAALRGGKINPRSPWLNPSGTLRRSLLGEWAFSSPSNLKTLNRIVHPALRRLLDREILRHFGRSSRPLILDMAVYPEKAFRGLARAVLWIRAPRALCARRLAGRSALSPAQARRRLRAQWPDSVFAGLADFRLDNRLTSRELRVAARNLWPKLLAAARERGHT